MAKENLANVFTDKEFLEIEDVEEYYKEITEVRDLANNVFAELLEGVSFIFL